MFLGRKQELGRIKKFLSSRGQAVCLIYGRRRVGKTELIRQAMKSFGAVGIYYECKETTEANNTESLASLMSEAFGYPKPAFRGMEDALGQLF